MRGAHRGVTWGAVVSRYSSGMGDNREEIERAMQAVRSKLPEPCCPMCKTTLVVGGHGHATAGGRIPPCGC